jgi:hypothetical protein
MAIIYPQFDDRPLSVDQINNNFRSIDNSLAPSSLRTTVLGTPDEYLYTEVTIPSGSLNGNGSGLILELLPDISSTSQYYSLLNNAVYIEFTQGNTPAVNSTGHLYVGQSDGNSSSLLRADGLLDTAGNKYLQLPIVSPYTTTVYDPPAIDGNVYIAESTGYTALYLGKLQRSDDTMGNGTMRIKIWYTIRTFGSEL